MKKTEHVITHESIKASDGNMNSETPICSCGWRGYPCYAYQDDQCFQLKRQAEIHKKEAKSGD